MFDAPNLEVLMNNFFFISLLILLVSRFRSKLRNLTDDTNLFFILFFLPYQSIYILNVYLALFGAICRSIKSYLRMST